MNKHNEDELKTKIRQALDESVDVLEANILSRIRHIRSQAIVHAQAVEKAKARHVNGLGIMSGALATACVMVFAVMILLQSPTPIQTIPVDDLEFISSSDNLELLEDLEFYEWLEEDVLPS